MQSSKVFLLRRTMSASLRKEEAKKTTEQTDTSSSKSHENVAYLNEKQSTLLVNGYCRCLMNIWDFVIPSEIIALFVTFYYQVSKKFPNSTCVCECK